MGHEENANPLARVGKFQMHRRPGAQEMVHTKTRGREFVCFNRGVLERLMIERITVGKLLRKLVIQKIVRNQMFYTYRFIDNNTMPVTDSLVWSPEFSLTAMTTNDNSIITDIIIAHRPGIGKTKSIGVYRNCRVQRGGHLKTNNKNQKKNVKKSYHPTANRPGTHGVTGQLGSSNPLYLGRFTFHFDIFKIYITQEIYIIKKMPRTEKNTYRSLLVTVDIESSALSIGV